VNGELNEAGRVIFNNRDIFQGEFYDGIPSGIGCYQQLNGFKFEGALSQGCINGEATFSYVNGDRY
jgi:hypothetical protein